MNRVMCNNSGFLLKIKLDIAPQGATMGSTHTENGATDMTFAQRLAQYTETAPSKETYNALKKPYEWNSEANQKRPVR